MTDISDSAFVTLVQYIFGDWWVWFRFTVTALLLKQTVLNMAVSGTTTFWTWATALFKKN